jgi:protein SCO1/2
MLGRLAACPLFFCVMKRTFLLSLFCLLIAACGEPARDSRLPPGGDFVLQSADGPVDTRQLRGQVLLVYFGYTHCPDICPASLAAAGQALNLLTADERAKVRLMMISVDPERDTLAHLKNYTAYFHAGMLGVTGTPDEVAAVARSFGAGYMRQPAKADGSYAVDHTVHGYLINRNGQLAKVIEFTAPPEQIAATLRQYF